jgi:pSer/pThr/pTyr-binding forkhead associated (FHA) protein
VSRWHARLERAVGRWVLTDLGSTNGTRLNGWRVQHPVPVQPGDQLSFGSARFVVRAGRPGGAWPVPPGEAAPGEAAPGEAAPGEAAPGEAAPGEAAPGQAPPGQPGPGPG